MFFTYHLKSLKPSWSAYWDWERLQTFKGRISQWEDRGEPGQWASPVRRRCAQLEMQTTEDTQPPPESQRRLVTPITQPDTQNALVTGHQPHYMLILFLPPNRWEMKTICACKWEELGFSKCNNKTKGTQRHNQNPGRVTGNVSS